MKAKRLIVLFILIALHGCSNHSGSSVDIGYSGFDNAKTVNIDPHGNICGLTEVCTGVGAQWNASEPEHAVMMIRIYHQYSAITGAEFNIDGEIVKLKTRSSTDFNTYRIGAQIFKESTNAFLTRVETIEKIISAKRVWLRIYTPTGHLENALIEDGKDSKAYHALNRFIDAVRG